MIKTFISHATIEDGFANWLKDKLEKDFRQLEIFVDHHDAKVGDDANKLMEKVEESVFFLAVCSTEYFSSSNCKAEIGKALKCRNKSGHKPIIFPLKFKCPPESIPPEIEKEIRYQLSPTEPSKGIHWEDFSNEREWDVHYENLRKPIQDYIVELGLLSDDADFYLNCQHLDIILKRNEPSPQEIKIVVDVYRQEEYQRYFFGKLDRLIWLPYLRNYGFFNRNPKPIENPPGSYKIPGWPVLDYLEKVSKECSKPGNEDYAKGLIQIIRDVTNYRDENGQKIDNYLTWGIFIKILVNLPAEVIKLEDMVLIEEWLDSRFSTTLVVADIGRHLVTKFLGSLDHEDWGKAGKIVEIVTKPKQPTRGHDEVDPDTVIDSYWLRELFKKNASLLGTRCGIQTIGTLVERIKEALVERKDEYSFIWRPAIEDHEQNIGDNTTRDVLVSALRDVLTAFLESEYPDKENVLNRLLNSELKTIKRIAIFTVGKKWGEYKHLFWQSIAEFINEISLKHEIFLAIKENFRKFDQNEKRQMIDCIEVGPKWLPEENKERYVVNWKLRWYAAMYSQGDHEFDALYAKYKAITGLEPEHPEFASYSKSYTGTVSPILIGELLKLSVPEIVQYLSEFKEPQGWPGRPSEEGLGDILKEAVKREPQKFASELDQFLEVELLYKHCMISALKELWQEKKSIDWERVLDFCLKIVSRPEFWKDETTYEDTEIRYCNWVTSAIADLIESGTNDDSWAFDKKHFPITENILLKILAHQESQMKEINDDACGHAINTTKGRVLIALINFALRVASVEKKDGIEKEVKWDGVVRKEFDSRLDKQLDPSLEFSTLVGHYLPNIYYLDKQWVSKNINRIFPKGYPDHWNVAMQGYLFRPVVYDYLYNLLREHSHYEKALETFKEEESRKLLLHDICTMYLAGKEELEGDKSLFARILGEWKQPDISEIISFFSMLRKVELEDNKRKRILDFWKYCYSKLSIKPDKNLDAADKKTLSDLNLLVVFLESISEENKEWLMLSAPYVGERHHSPRLIEHLDRLAEENPKESGEVYLHMLSKTIPYDEQKSKSFVEKLYRKGQKDLADRICNTYGKAGHYFLRDLYALNNP